MPSKLGPNVVGYSADYLAIAAVDKDYGIAIRYIGEEESGTVTVSATDSDITLQHGVLSSEAVDATVDSGDWSGASSDPGVIDMSDSSGMTMGEVVDLINDSANWFAMLIGCMRADLGTDALETLSETQARVSADKAIAVNYWGGIAIERTTVTVYATNKKAMGFLLSNKNLDWNHNAARRNVLASATISFTNAGTGGETNSILVYEVHDLTGAERLVYSKALGDDPSAVVIDDDDFGELLIGVEPGNGMLIRCDATAGVSATLTSPTVSIVGGWQTIPGEAAFRSRSYVADME